MERQTGLSQIIDTVADKARYDRMAKNLLAFKAVDAWILKTCVKEFYPYSVEYISEHCLTGKVEIADHAVHQDYGGSKEKIDGDGRITEMNSESSSINEGTVYYDVRFNALVPGSGEPVTLIINLEIQADDRPGYELVTRGMYYCARMISEQHGTVFTGNHYEKIQKVYSIWICPSTPANRRNGMYRYHTVEDAVIGQSHVKEDAYDKAEVIILNLGDAESEVECDILNLLNTLFSESVRPEEKKKVLSEKYNIAMTTEFETEVQSMCNLSTAIERRGIATGRSEGRSEGRLETTVMYFRKGRITLDEAASDLNMTPEEFKAEVSQLEGKKESI